MSKRRKEQGFTRWILALAEEDSPIGKFARRIRDDPDWMGFNRSFLCFVEYMKRRGATREDLKVLAQAWERYCGQQTPYLNLDYFDALAQKAYELALPHVSPTEEDYPVAQCGNVYIYALIYHEGQQRIRYIGQTTEPSRRLREHTLMGKNPLHLSALQAKGLIPSMVILDTVPKYAINEKEKAFAWYFHYIRGEGLGNQKIEFEA